MSSAFGTFLVLATAICAVFAQNGAYPDAFAASAGKQYEKFEGEACHLGRDPVNGHDSQVFYVCVKPNDPHFIWDGVGIWTRMRCAGTKVFSPLHGICRSSRIVKRGAQQYCKEFPNYCAPPQPVQPSSCYTPPCPPQPFPPQPVIIQPQPQPRPQPTNPCYQPPCQIVQPSCTQTSTCVDNTPKPCPSVSGRGTPGAKCSWMLERLAENPGNPKSYLQCAPSSPGEYCGCWMVRPCPAGTKFSVKAQVCVHDEQGCAPTCTVQPQTCGPQTYMGQCNQQQACPGASTQCVKKTCCGGGFYDGKK